MSASAREQALAVGLVLLFFFALPPLAITRYPPLFTYPFPLPPGSYSLTRFPPLTENVVFQEGIDLILWYNAEPV